MSNGYESMIFVAWGTLLAGFLVVRRSQLPLALTGVLAALSLLVAHLSWMNPEITPLVPVLKSVWLTIHVAVIMTSYSFLGLGALIGLITMILYIAKNKGNQVSLTGHIKHLTRLNKIVLIAGLYLITIGCFLGAIWANQSWGRYWGWDPKETWCLITILVYSFVGHMHNMKDFDTDFAFNLGSILAFGSVLMTYFGVNYFLGGMHSYAGGEPATVPIFAYVILIALIGLIYVAYFNELRFQPKKK
jgi:cytochrome c-type biogenesis protein CcsB